MARGIAYRTADGSVYFSIEKYRACGGEYGQLVKLDFDAMRPGERVSSDEYAKESVADFALWKARLAGGWRGVLGESLGRGPPRLAHRVQRDEHEAAGAEL
jgi:cysteinyl-tRNA synthetase